MNGTVRKRGNSWYYRLDLAYIDGERNQIERYGGRTKPEALEAMRKAIYEYETTGQLMDEADISIKDYFEYWYQNYVLINLKLNTQKNYRGILNNHIFLYTG